MDGQAVATLRCSPYVTAHEPYPIERVFRLLADPALRQPFRRNITGDHLRLDGDQRTAV